MTGAGRQRVKIDWEVLGDTAGAAAMAKALNVPFDQSQGAEIEPNSEATRFLAHNTNIKLRGNYNVHAGGHPELQQAIARDYRESFRIAVADTHAFAFQQLGRNVIEEAYKISAKKQMSRALNLGGGAPCILLEGLGWATLNGLAQDNNLGVDFYDPHATCLDAAIAKAINQRGPENVAAVVINRPRNPNSKESDRVEILNVLAVLDRFNAEPGVDITAIVDMPYAYGAPQLRDKEGLYLKTGFEGVLDDSWITKWIAIRTGGKEFGAANVGLAFAAASRNYPVAELVARVGRNGKGLVCNEQMMANLAQILGNSDFDDMKWANRAGLRAKYVENRRIFETAMRTNAVPGGANMLSLSEFTRNELIGRRVTGDHYGEWKIDNRYDLNAYLMHEHDVATVGMACERRPDSRYIRVAQRDEPATFGDGTEKLIEGLDRVRNSPRIAL